MIVGEKSKEGSKKSWGHDGVSQEGILEWNIESNECASAIFLDLIEI